MHESEANRLVRCADCGAEIDVSRERGYSAGPDTALCYACSSRRGGAWDEDESRWSQQPDLSGLAPPGPERLR